MVKVLFRHVWSESHTSFSCGFAKWTNLMLCDILLITHNLVQGIHPQSICGSSSMGVVDVALKLLHVPHDSRDLKICGGPTFHP